MAGFRDFWVRAALVLAFLVPVYFLVGALGTKFHLFDWRIGFGLMTYMWGKFVLIGVLAFAAIGLALAFFTPPRRGMAAALIAMLIPALGLGYGLYVGQQAQGVAPIHDISTDLLDPPGFSDAVVAARARVPGANDLDLLNKHTRDGRAFTALQQESYGDIASVPTGLDATRAFEVAVALAREQGWALGLVDADAGAIEATASSFWYGFTDDIAVRVRADGSGARVDMRSVSRVGGSDLGANAARMRPYLAELRARLEAAES